MEEILHLECAKILWELLGQTANLNWLAGILNHQQQYMIYILTWDMPLDILDHPKTHTDLFKKHPLYQNCWLILLSNTTWKSTILENSPKKKQQLSVGRIRGDC